LLTGPCNRTILELKLPENIRLLCRDCHLQSHHFGIETFFNYGFWSWKIVLQSHHFGIETKPPNSIPRIRNPLQSHHFGIETEHELVIALGHLVSCNRTILELKLRRNSCRGETPLLAIAPFWN